MQTLGYNYRITDFQCALGISQFKKLDKFIDLRRRIVNRYNEAFKDLKEIITPFEKSDVKSVYHLYMIQLNLEKLNVGRRQIFDALRAEKIGVHVHYIPIHLMPYYQERFGYKKGDFPIVEEFYNSALTLPLFPKMDENDVNDVIDAVNKVIGNYRK
jgi:dTDP-4-amino-4,6-dideoxygalactose transaminase